MAWPCSWLYAQRIRKLLNSWHRQSADDKHWICVQEYRYYYYVYEIQIIVLCRWKRSKFSKATCARAKYHHSNVKIKFKKSFFFSFLHYFSMRYMNWAHTLYENMLNINRNVNIFSTFRENKENLFCIIYLLKPYFCEALFPHWKFSMENFHEKTFMRESFSTLNR